MAYAAPAQPLSSIVSEVRIGGFRAGSRQRRGQAPGFSKANVNGEILFAKPQVSADPFWQAFVPRPTVGGSYNTGGGPATLSRRHLDRRLFPETFGRRVFLDGFFGGVAHNGYTGPKAQTPYGFNTLGCSPMFREAAALGYRLTEHWSVMATVEHMSECRALREQPRPLTNFGRQDRPTRSKIAADCAAAEGLYALPFTDPPAWRPFRGAAPVVKLNRIYTRTGDKGTTALADGQRRSKADLRVDTYGTVDETNACIGMVRLHTEAPSTGCSGRSRRPVRSWRRPRHPAEPGALPYEPLRIVASQVVRLERDIDALNATIPPLNSFVLPAGPRPPRRSPRPDRLPARRAAGGQPRRPGGRDRLAGGDPVPEPPLRLPVRGEPHGECRRGRRRALVPGANR